MKPLLLTLSLILLAACLSPGKRKIPLGLHDLPAAAMASAAFPGGVYH